MHPRVVIVAGLLAQALVAQNNPFIVFPQDPERQAITSASYVRRPDWNLAAEGFQEVGAAFRGVGDGGSGCQVLGFYHWAADENITTAEIYGIVLRSGQGTGTGPDVGPTGELLRVGNLSTPSGTGGPRGSWIMTDGFATPVTVPCAGEWFQGVDVLANPLWPASDGYSLWAADMPGISPATIGENPRAGVLPVTWRISASGVVAATQWTYILGVLVNQPMLHVGGDDSVSNRQGAGGGANIGMGGMFPDVSGNPRSDGIVLRVHDGANATGLAFFLGSTGYGPIAFPVPGLAGSVYVDPSFAATLGFVGLTGGAGELSVATPGSISPALVGSSFAFQALVVDPATLGGRFTNGQSTSL
ncbi:MAG: hypothetical protein IPK26_17275 [Planctomycetes bacterium]|nr:hypothetical protein [Planctomycetota bacterium]